MRLQDVCQLFVAKRSIRTLACFDQCIADQPWKLTPSNDQVAASVSPARISFDLALREPYFPSKGYALCSRQRKTILAIRRSRVDLPRFAPCLIVGDEERVGLSRIHWCFVFSLSPSWFRLGLSKRLALTDISISWARSISMAPSCPLDSGTGRRGHVGSAKSEFSGLGNFRAAPSQRTKIKSQRPGFQEILPQARHI